MICLKHNGKTIKDSNLYPKRSLNKRKIMLILKLPTEKLAIMKEKKNQIILQSKSPLMMKKIFLILKQHMKKFQNTAEENQRKCLSILKLCKENVKLRPPHKPTKKCSYKLEAQNMLMPRQQLLFLLLQNKKDLAQTMVNRLATNASKKLSLAIKRPQL